MTYLCFVFILGADDCEFYSGFCHWTKDSSSNNPFGWSLHKGPTPSVGTGPETDHSTGKATGTKHAAIFDFDKESTNTAKFFFFFLEFVLLSMCITVCRISGFSPVCLPFCLFVCLSVCCLTCLPVNVYICSHICLSVRLPVRLFSLQYNIYISCRSIHICRGICTSSPR